MLLRLVPALEFGANVDLEVRPVLVVEEAAQHCTNAIETFFRVMKSPIRKEELVGKAALLRSIPTALDASSRQQHHNFFSGAYEREGADKYERGISARHRTPKDYL